MLARTGDAITIDFDEMDVPLSIATTNRLQSRVVLLSLVNSGLISPKQAGEVLELSSVHVRNLASRLADGGVETLLDRRPGQQTEPVLTPQVKAEIVLQYSANAVTGRSTSSKAVVADIGERSGLTLPDRTLRHCIAKLVERIKRAPGDNLRGRVGHGNAAGGAKGSRGKFFTFSPKWLDSLCRELATGLAAWG